MNAGLWAAVWALVSGATNDIDVELKARVLQGKEQPSLTLHVHRAVQTMAVHICCGSQCSDQQWRGIKAGLAVSLPLQSSLGVSHCKGDLQSVFQGASSAQMPLEFDVEVGRAPAISVQETHIDLLHGRLELSMDRPAARCNYQVNIDGQAAQNGTATFAPAPAGTLLPVTWQPADPNDVVLRIALTCFDTSEFFGTLELFPWKLDIPHEDVLFATGAWDIVPSEMPKLHSAYAAIAQALARYQKVVAAKLFIVGHTDTVGSAADNRLLSWRRAQSLAVQFRTLGVHVPIYVKGRGEDDLRVSTLDNVADEHNRRAEYILAVDAPGDGFSEVK